MKDITNKTLKGLGFCATVGAIAVAGYLVYNVAYQNVNYTLANKNARNTYNERLAKFDNVSLDKDLSNYVFNLTGINVEENEYFKEINQKIREATTLEELRDIAVLYVEGYFEYNNHRLDSEKVELLMEEEGPIITYNDREVKLDSDAEVLFGELRKSIANIESETLDSEESKKKLVKQILVMQTYEPGTINENYLNLKPTKCPNDDFTF